MGNKDVFSGTSGITISDVLNEEDLEKSLTQFHKLIKLAISFVDLGGNILAYKGWTDICSEYHRKNPEICSLCVCNIKDIIFSVPAGEYRIHKCHSGLYHMTTPITAGGTLLGGFVISQFLMEDEPIDTDFFTSMAKCYGFDQDSYLDALAKIPIMNRAALSDIASFIAYMGNMLSSMALKNLRLTQGISENAALLDSLRQSEEKYRMLVEYQSDFILKADLEGRYTYVSPSYCDLMCRDESALLGTFITSDIYEDDLSSFESYIPDFFISPPSLHTIQMKTGLGVRWIQWTIKGVNDENGVPQYTIGTGRDITTTKLLEKHLTESQSRMSSMVSNIVDVLILTDADFHIAYASPNISKLFGWESNELIGTIIFEKFHPNDVQRSLRRINRLKGKSATDSTPLSTSGEIMYMSKESGYRNVYLTAVDLLNEPGVNGIMINFRDITKDKQKLEKIRFLSYRDVLTRLNNRTFHEAELKRLDAKKTFPVSIIVGDVNGLKLINDAFGHAEGDRALKRTAEILRHCCGTKGSLSRIGGDEFSIILPGMDSVEANALCNRISKYFQISKSNKIKFSISLGCETKTDPNESLSEVMKNAEALMYRHKLLESHSAHGSLISSIKAAMLEKSRETEEHEERIVSLTLRLGRDIGLEESELNRLELLATLHDIGKMSIDKRVLNKRGKLSDDEWFEIRKHPEAGYRIALASPELVHIADCILCHHENWDGSGYPQGLRGEEIPLLSRIVSVVDSYDAMTNDRVYRKAKDKEEVLEELKNNSGTQFDPRIVDAFIKII